MEQVVKLTQMWPSPEDVVHPKTTAFAFATVLGLLGLPQRIKRSDVGDASHVSAKEKKSFGRSHLRALRAYLTIFDTKWSSNILGALRAYMVREIRAWCVRDIRVCNI